MLFIGTLFETPTQLCEIRITPILWLKKLSLREVEYCVQGERLSLDVNPAQMDPDPLLLTIHCYKYEHREDSISGVHPHKKDFAWVPHFLLGLSRGLMRPLSIWQELKRPFLLPRSCHQVPVTCLYGTEMGTRSPFPWGTYLLEM